MKKIGIVGGLGAASTIDYYRYIIENLREEDNYPEIVIDSVNMKSVIDSIANKDYKTTASILLKSINNLKNAGAQFAAISANTPHIVWDYIKNDFPIPVISIVEETAQYIKFMGYKKVLVFGTKFTMLEGLYNAAFDRLDVDYVIPNKEDIESVANIIYPNLENGIVIDSDKKKMIAIAEKYIKEQHLDSLMLGCTEIPLMIKEGDVTVAILDTTKIHVSAICKYAKID